MSGEAEKVDLRGLFLALQGQLQAQLDANRTILRHPGAKGDAAELNWRDMLDRYLPRRYQVSKAFVLDADGALSDQIDIVIHDRHYSPFLLNQDGACYVPAESVYAVFEVKPELSKDTVEYAADKAASVRRLRRTSVGFPHAGGRFEAREHFPVLAGLVCLESAWSPPFGEALDQALQTLPTDGRLDLICAVRRGAVEVAYDGDGVPTIRRSASDAGLIFFSGCSDSFSGWARCPRWTSDSMAGRLRSDAEI